MELLIGAQKLDGPVLIPSISNFETQGLAVEAIKLQHALNEPITLVSAHDTAGNKDLVDRVIEFRDNNKLVFIDSGGYESSRIGRYVDNYSKKWDFAAFRQAVTSCPYDLAASYDYFIEESMSAGDYAYKLLDGMRDHDFIDDGKLVPVVHLKDFSGARYLSRSEAVDIVDRVAIELDPQFIAIPERELGNGLAQKAELVRAIVDKLRSKGRRTELHILGCGNPLSFAILANAGIAMADGLEWCRTLVGPQFHLHHFQQAELFPQPENAVYNPMAELIRDEVDSYQTKTLARNLHALQGFAQQVSGAIRAGSMKDFVNANFGPDAAAICG
ncbi:hypothetical protein FJ987_29740 [Mesorhizobium sp. CU2]|uniref:hypothetical protein n=1 Tax=unclassified Mesorhizobium TaxID=325217 RepID=UPI001127CB84|nr:MULTISPECIES: hypothetical protein [unclassified Mesorhizobium]TPN75447.1 hypothetical protein FJ988_29525 [Mesorhizobium sp. CU3]TPO01734.1 hypothetical protein FJ987_29740 [Mesorhizobium sp. CU2]